MKLYFFSLLICISALTFLNFSNPVDAYTNSHKIGVNTDERGIEGIASLKLDYELTTEVKHDDNVEPGKSQNWNLSMKNGKITLQVDIAGQHIPITQEYQLGKRIDIHAAPGIGVNLFATASAPVIVNGPAHSNTNTLEWSSQEPQSFTLFISENAMKGEKIEVRVPVKINVNVGLSIDLLILKKEIGSIPIGSFEASPEIIETVEVGKTTFDWYLPMAIGIILGIGGIIAVFLLKNRKPAHDK